MLVDHRAILPFLWWPDKGWPAFNAQLDRYMDKCKWKEVRIITEKSWRMRSRDTQILIYGKSKTNADILREVWKWLAWRQFGSTTRWHLEHKHGLGLRLVLGNASAFCRGSDLRRGRLRGLHGGRPTVTCIMGQLGGGWQGWVRELFNVRMWGRGLGGLFLPKGLFEWASQLKKRTEITFLVYLYSEDITLGR